MKRTVRYLAAAAALGLFVGAFATSPATAKPDQKPINGKIDLTLHLFPCQSGTFLTWTGTVVIDGVTYGFADEPLPFEVPQVPNEKFLYFEEHWTIFDLEVGEDPNDDPSLACDTGRTVLEGTNTGWLTLKGWTGKAEGVVTDASGPFASVESGSRMFWNGKVLDFPAGSDWPPGPGTEFKATLHITR